VTAVGTGTTQCWLQGVSGCYLSVCLYVCLSIVYTSNASVDMLPARQFIQLVALSLFLSLSTVHCYTLRTSALAKTFPPPLPILSALGHTFSPSCGRPLWMSPYELIICDYCCCCCWRWLLWWQWVSLVTRSVRCSTLSAQSVPVVSPLSAPAAWSACTQQFLYSSHHSAIHISYHWSCSSGWNLKSPNFMFLKVFPLIV